MHDEQSFGAFSAVDFGWGPLKWVTPSFLQSTSGDRSSEGEGLVPPCLREELAKATCSEEQEKEGDTWAKCWGGEGAEPGTGPCLQYSWHLAASLGTPHCAMPSCQPVLCLGAVSLEQKPFFFAVETCSPFNYFSIAKIKIKYLRRNLSGLFQPWHKLAVFQFTDLYQTLLCHTHSLHLSVRMKRTVSSRFQPAYTGAAGRSCVCVAFQAQGFGLDFWRVCLLWPRPLPLWLSQWLSLSVCHRCCFSSGLKTQMISHSFLQEQGGTIFSCVTQHPGGSALAGWLGEN